MQSMYLERFLCFYLFQREICSMCEILSVDLYLAIDFFQQIWSIFNCSVIVSVLSHIIFSCMCSSICVQNKMCIIFSLKSHPLDFVSNLVCDEDAFPCKYFSSSMSLKVVFFLKRWEKFCCIHCWIQIHPLSRLL